MANFAVVLCQSGVQEPVKRRSIIKRILLYFKRIFVKRVAKIDVENCELFENTSLFTFNLPCKIEDLRYLNKTETEKLITELIVQNHISTCIIPDSLMDKLNFQNCMRDWVDSRCLYFSLLRYIIETVCKNKNMNLYELDITIISGDNNDNNLRALIEYIAPHVKFLTIVNNADENKSFDLDELLNEYGLSARVTDNLKGALKDAHIIINLANTYNNSFLNLKVRSDCSIINYGEFNEKGFKDGLMINGINVLLPNTIYKKLDKRIIDYFTSYELSEMIICHKLSIEDVIKTGQINSKHMNKVLKEFITNKFAISSFNGRHGPVSFKQAQ